MSNRRAYSLVEVLVVIGILGVLFALLLGAIQNVRAMSLRLSSINNLRQIILATHQYTATRTDSLLPGIRDPQLKSSMFGQFEETPFISILPYLEGDFDRPRFVPGSGWVGEYGRVKTYISPADPSIDRVTVMYVSVTGAVEYGGPKTPSSYAFNMCALSRAPIMPSGFPDGTSLTIAFVERYYCCGRNMTRFNYDEWQAPWGNEFANGEDPSTRRATFADAPWRDVVPVVQGNPPVARASVPGLTFQVRPRPEDANYRIAQTPHAAGLPAAHFDGSVHVIAPSVSEQVFWGMVTRDGGEWVE